MESDKILEQVQRYALVKTAGMFGDLTGEKRMVVSSEDGEWVRWDDVINAMRQGAK